MREDTKSRIHMTSPDKGWYEGDDNLPKNFTLIKGTYVFDDLLEECIYRDRVNGIK